MELPPKRSPSVASGPSTGLVFEALIEDAQKLSPEAFQQKFGSGFLLATATRLFSRRNEPTTELLLDDESDPAERTADLGITVYPLRPAASSPGTLVTVGRGTGHDVLIPDASISRFHAFAKQGPDGEFMLQDADSTNGSSVNGTSVATRGAGPPTPLKPGDTVRLGRMEFTFVDAPGLRSFVLEAGA